MPEGVPYWRLSAFYLFFFAILGALAPYWGPYLRSVGFDAAQIGQLVAVLHATKIIAPNLWGWIADHTGRGMAIVRLATGLAMVVFAGVLWARGFWAMAALMAGFSFFWNAALPQFEANTMNHLGGASHRYSRIRLWGSVGFIVTVTGLGELIDRLGVEVVPAAVLLLFAGLGASSLLAPTAARPPPPAGQARFRGVLARPEVLSFFAVCFLLQASHGPFYAFYSIYLQDHGYSGGLIGVLWALGVVAEILVFLRIHRWLPRFGPRRLIAGALGLAVARWLLVGALPGYWPAQALAQLLHAATFGVYHAVAIALVNRFFVGSHQGRGQALYSSLTFGAGVAAGSLASGLLWDVVGAEVIWYLAAAVAACGIPLALRGVPRYHEAPPRVGEAAVHPDGRPQASLE